MLPIGWSRRGAGTTVDLLVWAGEIKFGGILGAENDCVTGATFFCCIDVWFDNFLGRNIFVIAESVGGFEFDSYANGGGDAGVGAVGEGFEDGGEALVESLVVELCGVEFVFAPVSGHGDSVLQKHDCT